MFKCNTVTSPEIQLNQKSKSFSLENSHRIDFSFCLGTPFGVCLYNVILGPPFGLWLDVMCDFRVFWVCGYMLCVIFRTAFGA